MKGLSTELAQREQQQLYRSRRVVEGLPAVEALVDGRPLLTFCSNDYLGLAGDARVRSALQRGAERYGVGSTAAHLVSGHTRAHHALEEELAEFTGRERALLFSTGYMANLGVIASLVGRGGAVVEDRLNHASLIDGARLSRGKLLRYGHADADACGARLAELAGDTLVATDGVFSMDGDLAPLPELAKTCRRHGAWMLVDDAHGIGVLGKGGRGSLSHFGLTTADVPVLMGTLGKALGTFGAFVAGSEELVETLIQSARPYIYTTAPPPAVAEATRESLRRVQQDEWRRHRLNSLIAQFRGGAAQLGLPLMDSNTPIQPLMAGSAERALAWSSALESAGILVIAIRPPTVPVGAARLRITLSAAHTEAQVDRLLDALQSLPGVRS
ncbi:MAG: 8-amino-7-oxononanoate synthase [Pseudomonadota bacterium]